MQHTPYHILVLVQMMTYLTVQDEGVKFATADGVRHFHGSLSICSGDNPALYEIGGFKNLTGALRKCRFCMTTKEDMNSMVI